MRESLFTARCEPRLLVFRRKVSPDFSAAILRTGGPGSGNEWVEFVGVGSQEKASRRQGMTTA